MRKNSAKDAWKTLEKGTVLKEGSQVATYEDSTVEFQFGDNTLITLPQNAQITIDMVYFDAASTTEIHDLKLFNGVVDIEVDRARARVIELSAEDVEKPPAFEAVDAQGRHGLSLESAKHGSESALAGHALRFHVFLVEARLGELDARKLLVAVDELMT